MQTAESEARRDSRSVQLFYLKKSLSILLEDISSRKALAGKLTEVVVYEYRRVENTP